MYSEDLYAASHSDHTVLYIYCAVFALVAMGALLRMTFLTGNSEYKHVE
jgi:hypothetical protein